MKEKLEPRKRIATILDVLCRLRGQEIVVTTSVGVWTGKVSKFDNQYILLEDMDGISLLKIREIIAIDWAPKIEVIAP